MTRLVADIGGTHARLALADGSGRLLVQERLPTAAFDGFPAALQHFLATVAARGNAPEPVRSACVAVAGPVRNGSGYLVNGTWTVTENEIGNAAGGVPAQLLNDLQAAAHGVPLASARYLTEGPVLRFAEPVLVIGIGTGVGGSLLVPAADGGGRTALATEIGHGILSTTGIVGTDSPVSVENLLSGTGLPRLYGLVGGEAAGLGAAAVLERLSAGEPAAERMAVAFTALLGRFAATAALTTGATGGIVFVGGMLPRMIGHLDVGRLIAAVRLSGPMKEWLCRVPLAIVTDDEVALKGLAGLPES